MGNFLSFGHPQSPADSGSKPAGVKKISDALYELYAPAAGHPEVDIIFFHGLQAFDYVDAYWKTWSSDGTTIWPREFLGADFPKARVLSVSYDSSAVKSTKAGRFDLYNIGENMVQDILLDDDVEVGQGGRPVILVGHSLGGFALKMFLLMADKKRHESVGPSKDALSAFLDKSLAGVFYYATPHGGCELANVASKLPKTSSLMYFLRTLGEEAARLNSEFSTWRKVPPHSIPVYTIAESQPTRLWGINAIVVPEASARHDTEDYYTARADHITVCKPTDKTARTYKCLRTFIRKNVSGIQISDRDALQELL